MDSNQNQIKHSLFGEAQFLFELNSLLYRSADLPTCYQDIKVYRHEYLLSLQVYLDVNDH